MENAYSIHGGHPLKGEIQLSGAKNVSLKVIIASLLFEGEVYIANVPRIKDIEELLHLITSLGGHARFTAQNEVVVDKKGMSKNTIDLLQAIKTRVSFMFFAPLLHLLGSCRIPNPGGCRIGARPIDRQIDIMEAMGVSVEYDEEDGYYKAQLTSKKFHGVTHRFEKRTHTGTEFGIMLGALAQGKTIIENASLEPEIDDLINFLQEGGAQIARKGDSIIISGVSRLTQHKKYSILYDRNEAVTYGLLALATKGDITVHGVGEGDLIAFLEKLKKAGGGVAAREKSIRFFYKGELAATQVETAPHPGFMTDWQAPWAVLMTQARGVSTIHETVFENRFAYVEELLKLGARIEFFKPEVEDPSSLYQFNIKKMEEYFFQGIKIFGQTSLHNAVLTVSDLRAGASLLIAASIAKGQTIVCGASVIDRGYEHIDTKLKSVGARIQRI